MTLDEELIDQGPPPQSECPQPPYLDSESTPCAFRDVSPPPENSVPILQLVIPRFRLLRLCSICSVSARRLYDIELGSFIAPIHPKFSLAFT